MNEAIERVARAIFSAGRELGAEFIDSVFSAPAGSSHAILRDGAIREARAAIEAIREPSDEMAFAGAKALATEMQAPSAALMAIGYVAMIDAALKD